MLRSPGRLFSGLSHDLITTVFPGDCRICAEPLDRAGRVPVCDTCLESLQPRTSFGCRRCGDLLPTDDLEDLRFRGMECMSCRLVPPAFERAVAFGDYEDVQRELIHLFKFGGVTGLARTLGGHLAEAILSLQDVAARELLVIAVPLFAGAERRRGFNQARLLADSAVSALHQQCPAWHLEPVHHLLVRKRSTAHQFELSRRDRRRNLEGAFAVPPGVRDQLAGREVLLVDDVLTTGATARECARVLRRAGAEKVWVATVARACGADRPRRAARHRLEDAVARWDHTQ